MLGNFHHPPGAEARSFIASRESALDTSTPANRSAAVSPMGERGGAAEPQPGTGRARCVPDQPVTWGISRSLAGSPAPALRDRKSTRLNSSHVEISYAVFCLKKK